ncbi:MAG: restriction endonuclease subunit S [Chromatiaceae bacterium]|nr:restriction endonuclease subunit S [Chromatiaceae bacterium]
MEQDPGDEPASALLKRIAQEKARQVQAGEIRKPRDLSTDQQMSEPFDIPASWRWCRLDVVGAVIGGGTPSAADVENFAEPTAGIPWLTPADLGGYTELYIARGSRDLSEKGFKTSSATMLPAGSVLFTSRAPIGYVAIAANPVTTNQGFKSIIPYVSECSRFIALAMKAFAPEINAKAPGTTFKEVSGKIVAGVSLPLPPLAEQHRIVAKVDELMALCDRLEAAQNQREQRRDQLAAASLRQLQDEEGLTPRCQDAGQEKEPDEKDLGALAPWRGSVCLQNIPRLTTRPEHIKALRQTILNLAVRGRLVPQDPSDVPAAELLKEIEVEKSRLIKDGMIPRSKASIGAAKLSFELPCNWRAIRFDDVCNLVTSGARGWAEYYADSGPKFVRAQNIRFGRLRLDDLACVRPPANNDGKRTQIAKNDIVIVITGAGVTNPALMDRDLGEAYVSQHVALIKPTKTALSRWLLLCLMSGAGGRETLIERAYGAGKPGLNLDNIRSLSSPLPPLAEQHRIVAKVDELMAVCDQLEANLTATQTDSRRLLQAVLHEALAPARREAA